MHCPHCDAALGADWALERTGRCPTCRLVVGAGRATAGRGGGSSLSGAGTAAGILSGAARREDAAPGEPAVVADALCQAARLLGVEIGRLRMLDYQLMTERDPELPSLGVVLATFGTWKLARNSGARQTAPEPHAGGRRSLASKSH